MSDEQKAKPRALGRGLDALLPNAAPAAARGPAAPAAPPAQERTFFLCPVEKITPQKGQPRQYFDEEKLEELTGSIREHGLIEPLVVRRAHPGADRFELIAGERRWRASQRAGLKEVPVVVKDVSPNQAFVIALVENIQRADLNPIEIAESFDRLLREHGYTQQTLADRIGRDRATITNSLRLLKLPPRIRTMVISHELSEGHARALLGAPSEKAMSEIADKTVRGKLPVRRVEQLVRTAKARDEDAGGTEREGPPRESPAIRDLRERLMRRLGTRIDVRDEVGRGELVVHYSSLDELDRILAIFGA